jgi:hypothetical protein
VKSFEMNEAQKDAYHKWIELDAEAVGWNLQRQFKVVPHVAAAIVEKFKSGEQWARAQAIILDSAKQRIAWLESKVDPELLKPQPRDTVSCKPPAEASD